MTNPAASTDRFARAPLYLFARTPLHVGSGKSVGVVDAPIARERHTRIPVIPGSSLKGVLADLWPTRSKDDNSGVGTEAAIWLFGSESSNAASAGALLVGEARVLAFPVRSAKGAFVWITCPLAISRFARETGLDFGAPAIAEANQCLASSAVTIDDNVILEEYCLTRTGDVPAPISTGFKRLIDDPVWTENISVNGASATDASRIVVVTNEVFCHFVDNACEVVDRIKINNQTGTAENLFNQENVPSETLFYAVMAAQASKCNGDFKSRTAGDALTALAAKLQARTNLIQIGGDETIGLGWCSVTLCVEGGK